MADDTDDEEVTTSSLLQYLENERKINQNSLDMLKSERIDESTLPLLSEEELEKFLPLKGDRLASRRFCAKADGKKTLLDRLRGKFASPNSVKSVRSGSKMSKLVGNDHAAKCNRNLEIGWMDFCSSTTTYKQVRSQKGGGTRVVNFSKKDKASFVLEKGISLFFPNGKSLKGSAAAFTFKLCDSNFSDVDESFTVGDLYARYHMRTLRLYMCSKQNVLTAPKVEVTKQPRKKRARKIYTANDIGTSVGESILPDLENKSEDKKDPSYTSQDLESTVDTKPKNKIIDKTDLPHTSTENIIKTAAEAANIPTHTYTDLENLYYRDSDVSFTVPYHVYEETLRSCKTTDFDNIISSEQDNVADKQKFNHVAQPNQSSDSLETRMLVPAEILDQSNSLLNNSDASSLTATPIPKVSETLASNSQTDAGSPYVGDSQLSTDLQPTDLLSTFELSTITSTRHTTVEMNIHRGPMAFRELIGYFKDENITDQILKINRILPDGTKELAQDTGGVLRDLLIEFWASFYDLCTMGRDDVREISQSSQSSQSSARVRLEFSQSSQISARVQPEFSQSSQRSQNSGYSG